MIEKFLIPRQLYYRINDFDSNRETIIFIHGVSGSSSAWKMYEEKFKNIYNIISLDLRGHGKSYKPNNIQDYAIEFFAEDIYELLRYLKVKRSVIISHSFGSIIALYFVKKYQEMVSKLILLSPQSSVINMLSAKIIKPLIDFSTFIFPRPKYCIGQNHVDYSIYKNSGDWHIARTFADIKNTGLRIYLYCTKQTYAFDGNKILKDIHIPTLIIHGENDSIFPVKYGKYIHNKIKNSKIAIIKKTNHILVLNNFNEVSKLIEDFIEIK